ncbi:MAG: OmpA family protein [Bacteroidota bacterium]|nr:OmpA family protein [Bacteroidota bacterium]
MKCQIKHIFVSVFFFIFFSLQINFLQAQIADELFENFEYSKTIEFYKNNKIADNNFKALSQLGICYFNVQDYKNAESTFKKLLPIAEENPIIYFYYAESLKNNNKIIKSKQQFLKYSQLTNTDVKKHLASCDSIKYWKKNETTFNVFSVDKINNSSANFSPNIYKEGIIFASENNSKIINEKVIPPYSEKVSNLQYGMEQSPFIQYFYSPILIKDKKLIAKKPKNISFNIEQKLRNGQISFDKTNSLVYISKTSEINNPQKPVNTQIYKAQIDTINHKIGEFSKVNFIDTAHYYSFGHPFITKQGKTMYFSSNIPDGFGGFDIYMSNLINGKWTTPKNLGKQINSLGDDIFPCFDNNQLFFASNGLAGYGGLDIFVSKLSNSKWTKALNLKSPINSHADDFGLMFLNSYSGFFCSNRFGGKGDDDIYIFENLKKKEKAFEIKVDTVIKIVKEPVNLTFGNILFEFDSFSISNYFKTQLDTLYQILKDNNKRRIGIYGFSDPKGSSEYNIKLSKKRSESVFKYLVERGVEKNRIEIKAKGEINLLENCISDSCIKAQDSLKRKVKIIFNPKAKYKNKNKSMFVEFDGFTIKEEIKPQLLEFVKQINDTEDKKYMTFVGYSDSINDVVSANRKIKLINSFLKSYNIVDDVVDKEIRIIHSSISQEEAILNKRIEVIIYKK